ncbi:hypothetical protein QBC40DRAFT_292205 [Triangularia verruculosa]|uniref:Uncharacterized protein n=1 Tax=Triangularia verruculosa TaxID=2587418 RepID=A0AAN7B069_9PEZI|nr:hypothetical protein QBC40DRAFT_292205 [Triangularia verruculosa]
MNCGGAAQSCVKTFRSIAGRNFEFPEPSGTAGPYMTCCHLWGQWVQWFQRQAPNYYLQGSALHVGVRQTPADQKSQSRDDPTLLKFCRVRKSQGSSPPTPLSKTEASAFPFRSLLKPLPLSPVLGRPSFDCGSDEMRMQSHKYPMPSCHAMQTFARLWLGPIFSRKPGASSKSFASDTLFIIEHRTREGCYFTWRSCSLQILLCNDEPTLG